VIQKESRRIDRTHARILCKVLFIFSGAAPAASFLFNKTFIIKKSCNMKPAWMKGHIGVRFSSSLMACAGVVAVLFAQRPESSEELMRSSNGLMFIKPASNFRHMMSQAKKLPYKQENLYEGHEESISPGSLASKTPNFSAKGYWHQLQLHEQVQSQQLSRQHRCQRACGSWPECDCGICIHTHTHTHTHTHIGDEATDKPWQQPRLSAEQQDALPPYPFFPAPLAGFGFRV